MKSAKREKMFSLKEFIIIVPRAISNFSWGNETNIIRLRKKEIKFSVAFVIMICIPVII